MSFTDLIVDALATQRLTRLVTEDVITEDIRGAITDRFPPTEHKLGYLVTCPHCVSVYAGAAVTILRLGSSGLDTRRSHVFASTLAVLRYTLALSGAVSLGNEVAAKLPDQL